MKDRIDAEEFLQLIRQFLNRELPAETFCHQFIALWMRRRDAHSARLQDWVDPLHSACSVFWHEPEQAWEINEEQLRFEMESAMAAFRSWSTSE